MSQTCIYCRSTTGPFTEEHVLGRSLGGNLKIPDVCHVCNNQMLSRIDQALAERSTLSFHRLIATPATQEVRLGGSSFIAENDLDVEIRLGNQLNPRALPQIHAPLPFTPERATLKTHGDSVDALNRFVELIESRMAAGTFQRTRIFMEKSGTLRTIILVQRQSNELVVRAESIEQGHAFLAWLEQCWSIYKKQYAPEGVKPQPSGQDLRTEFVHKRDDYQRAVAKTALNYLCHVRGAEFALLPEFDRLRSYVLGIDLQIDVEALENGDVAHDSRYVTMLPPGESEALIPSDRHVILLATVEQQLVAMITFYGAIHYLVRVGSMPAGDEVFAGHEFSVDRSSNEDLPLQTIVRRIIDGMRAASFP